jgi:NF-kappa-B inhibitor alpha
MYSSYSLTSNFLFFLRQLHISIIQGFIEAAFFLVSMVPHPCLLNILNDDAQAALHLAVLTQQPRIVRRLVLAGADLTVRNFRGNTPLHLACISGDIYCVKALTNQFTPAERTWLEPGQKLPLLPQNLEQRNYDGTLNS